MVFALLVLYAVSLVVGLVSTCLAWYNVQQSGAIGLVKFVFIMSVLPVINTVWAFGFVVFMMLEDPKTF